MKKESKFNNEISKEEKILKKEIVKEEKAILWFFKSHTFKILITVLIFIALIFSILYLANSAGRIYIEDSEIKAPVITLSPISPGILDNVYVKTGDYISADTIVAQVNGVSIKSKVSGIVIGIQDTPGQLVSSQTPVVLMIDPQKLRVIGHIEENKGLVDIKQGQKVIFTVDAFASKEFEGIVESVASAPGNSDIVFSISDNRQEKQFDIQVRFDTNAYSELKQGMSARMWVYK